MMVNYDDEIMQDEDWLYEEEKPKKKTNSFSPYAKQIPPEWTLKGCETVDDPAEKERLRKELEKKEKQRAYQRNYYAKNKEKLEQQKKERKLKKQMAAAKKNDDESKDLASIVDLVQKLDNMDPEEFEAMETKIVKAEFVSDEEQVEEPDIDTSLERLAKLRELAETEQAETTETENTTTEEPTEIVTEPEKVTEIVSEAIDPVPDQGVVVAEIAPTMADDITLVLTTSEAESLYEFIKDELLTVVKRDDIEEMDWLVDMCSIYNSLRKVLIRNG